MQLKDVAVVLLCYADYESLEIALAAHTKFMEPDTKIFLLQNGRGTYDCERTYRVAKRYADLFPRNIVVVDWIEPQKPYLAIKELLNSKIMQPYSYICKVDDDVFPVTEGWLKQLIESYNTSSEKYGDDLAYVTSLVNNNPWGFIKTLEIMDLKEEYLQNVAREHIVGKGELVSKDEIRDGLCGTVWHNPYISRWLHKKTTLNIEEFIDKCKSQSDCLVNHKERYSINCMLFKKELWNAIDIKKFDDEYMCHQYCLNNDKKIVARCNVPMIHLFFYSQREENKDLIPNIRNYYEKFLQLPFPISICPNKEYENENRLRYIEQMSCKNDSPEKFSFIKTIFSIRNSSDKTHKIITILGIKIKIKRIKKVSYKQ